MHQTQDWGLRYTVALRGGAAIFGVSDKPKSDFIKAFDEAEDLSWVISKLVNLNLDPAISLPMLLPALLHRSQNRNDLIQRIKELKLEFDEPVDKFHCLLASKAIVNPDFQDEAIEAAQELNKITKKFFLLAKTKGQPSFLRRVSPKAIVWIGTIANFFQHYPEIVITTKIIQEILEHFNSANWAIKPFTPSLSDRLYGLSQETKPEQFYTLLSKHLSPAELQALHDDILKAK